MCAMFVFSMHMQECRKALKSRGAQRLNMFDLYGKNVIPMEKLHNLGWPRVAFVKTQTRPN